MGNELVGGSINFGGPCNMNDYRTIVVSEYFLKDKGIEIPEEWLEVDNTFTKPVKILRLLTPELTKTKYHDIFYEKYFEKYPEELSFGEV